MNKQGNGILFQRVSGDAGKWSVVLTEFTDRQRTEHEWEIDEPTAESIKEALQQALPKNEMVWLKELSHIEGSEVYSIRFDLKAGKSRKHITKACSSHLYDSITAIMKAKWWNKEGDDAAK